MYAKKSVFSSKLVHVSYEVDDGIAIWTESENGRAFMHLSEQDMEDHKDCMLGLAETIEQFYQDKEVKKETEFEMKKMQDAVDKLNFGELGKAHN
jgi:hypothetical protein